LTVKFYAICFYVGGLNYILLAATSKALSSCLQAALAEQSDGSERSES